MSLFFKKILIVVVSFLSLSCFSQGLQDLKITEIMYHPNDEGGISSSDLEFLELKNTGDAILNLKGVSISEAIGFSFVEDYFLLPDSFAVLVSDSNSFHIRYPNVAVAGQYSGQLANSGEELAVMVLNDVLISFEYSDDLPWPVLADGAGFSLVPVSEGSELSEGEGGYWRNSSVINGSPGSDDLGVLVNYSGLWINELLSNTDLPQLDAVEIYNAEEDTIDMSYWFLSDSKSNLYKYQFPPNSKIAPGEFLVVDENDFNVGINRFSFNRTGDGVYLFSSNSTGDLTGFATGWKFDAQFNGVSFGRHKNKEGDLHFIPLTEVTLGASNSAPKLGPLAVVNIMYNPDYLNEEYLIIQNTTDSLLPLFHKNTPDSSWKVTGIDFTFPKNTSMKAGEKVVLTSMEPLSFRTKYGLNDSVQVFQYSGKISNGGEEVALWWFDRLYTSSEGKTFMPMVLIEAVDYKDSSPWPEAADGYGHVLMRKDFHEYANDYENWGSGPDFPFYSSWGFADAGKQFVGFSVLNSELFIENPNNIRGALSVYSSCGKLVTHVDVRNVKTVVSLQGFANGVFYCGFSAPNYYESYSFVVTK